MSKIEDKIVSFLADYPEKEFYGQEIAKKVNCSKASASGLLKVLTAKKIVHKKTKGHMNFYQINQKSLEVKKFKINLALAKIKPAISKLDKLSQKIILFGSASRGEQTFDSDLDLFILAGNNKEEIKSELKKINSKLRINAVIKNHSEWAEMEIKDPEFYREVNSGIILYEYVPRI